MIEESALYAQLPFCLSETNFAALGTRYIGKVRDSYSLGGKRILITSDRLSCFDVVVTTIPFKGQVLTQLALYWFEKASSIVPVHVISSPDPNVIIGKEASVIPVEVVVRGYLSGSAWRDYEAGRTISGVSLPKGMKQSQKLPHPLITPATKAQKGEHDEPISEEEVVNRKVVSSQVWQQVRTAALRLFDLGTSEAEKKGLILADTKYEFGISNGELLLVDEIHTLDSSRYWVASDYQERFETGKAQVMLDKEPTRQWLIRKGFMGEGAIPEFTDEHRVAIGKHYIDAYEKITGRSFHPVSGDPLPRIEAALRSAR